MCCSEVRAARGNERDPGMAPGYAGSKGQGVRGKGECVCRLEGGLSFQLGSVRAEVGFVPADTSLPPFVFGARRRCGRVVDVVSS